MYLRKGLYDSRMHFTIGVIGVTYDKKNFLFTDIIHSIVFELFCSCEYKQHESSLYNVRIFCVCEFKPDGFIESYFKQYQYLQYQGKFFNEKY